MFNADDIKRTIDLLTICEMDSNLKWFANTNGGEYKGSCPFCGGTDRFYVQPNAKPIPRWACRNCTPNGDNVLGYIARRDGLDRKRDFPEICKRAAGGYLATTERLRTETPLKPAYSPPNEDWQKAAAGVIEKCQDQLWQPGGLQCLQYLRSRGLKDRTIKYFRLGFSSGEIINGLYVPEGVVIPCVVAGQVWYVKVRQPPDVTPKYKLVIGSRPAAIFNADNLASDAALFCEGEFDCMIAHQELNDVIPCVTLGSASNTLDLASWGAYLMSQHTIFSAYDSDLAGEKGSDRLYQLAGDRVKLCPVPSGKDINEFFLANGDLWQWIKPYLFFYELALHK